MYPGPIIVLCLSMVHLFLCFEETNARDNPIFEYLKVNPNHVLEHEIVKIDLPQRFQKRDLRFETPLRFQALGMDVDLLLNPVDSVFASDGTLVKLAHYAPQQGMIYYEKIDVMSSVGQLLEDPNHFASVVLGSNQFGHTTANGYLRSRRDNTPLIIRSLPEHVANGYLRDRRAIDDLGKDYANSTYHFVAKLNDFQKDSANDLYRALAQRSSNLRNDRIPTGPNVDYPANWEQRHIVYPQLLIRIDSSFKDDLAAQGIVSFLEYVLAFWNGVDMIYRSVGDPKITLNIAGIVIATHPFATPDIADNMQGPDTLYYDRTLDASSRFQFDVQNEFPFESYDIAVTMTKFNMVDENNNVALGYAYLEGACTIFPDAQRNNGVGLIRDSGAFSGIVTAAHEVGHLLGLQHDDSNQTSPCAASPRFTMAAQLPGSSDASWFSDCSLASFFNNYNAGKYSCMFNVPRTTGRELPKIMPGKIASATRQCAAFGYGAQCSVEGSNKDVCAELWCFGDDGLCHYRGWGGAAPGTPCGSERDVETKFCLLSRCVAV